MTLSAQVLGDSQLCCFKPSGLCYCIIVVPRLPSVLEKKFLRILIIRMMAPVEHRYPPVFILWNRRFLPLPLTSPTHHTSVETDTRNSPGSSALSLGSKPHILS